MVAFASLAILPAVLGSDILRTNGFSNCNSGSSTLKVDNVDISFDKSTNKIDFDVSGTSSMEQFVTADLIVTAYGVKVYNNSFDPCADDTKVDQLCPGKSPAPRSCLYYTNTAQCLQEPLLPVGRKSSPPPTPPLSHRSRTHYRISMEMLS